MWIARWYLYVISQIYKETNDTAHSHERFIWQ
jgi:hypothetical protein